MCNAPKIPTPRRPKPIAPLQPPQPTATALGTPDVIRQQRSRANLGISQLQKALRIPSGVNIPQ